MKRKIFYLFFAVIFIIVSCNLGFTPTKTYYYIQQQEEEPEKEDIAPSEDIDLSFGIMFDILEKKGVINRTELEEYLLKNESVLNSDSELLQRFYTQLQEIPAIKKEENASFPLIDFSTFDFSSKVLKAKFSDKNVPEMWYEEPTEESKWELSEDRVFLTPITGDENTRIFSYSGLNTTAGENAITGVTYFKYESKNPFFAIDSGYNTDTYKKSETTPPETETGMERFLFYRFMGKGGGIVDLDNMLVAVDTYTSLIFAFGVPTEFDTFFGQDSPTKWEAAETAATAADGQKYKFYEYDPAGYVDSEGHFVMYDWYIDNLSQANKANQTKFHPQFTGVSPYLVNLELKRPTLTVTSNKGDENNGYYTEISGFEFADAPKSVESYSLYRIDDSSTEKRLLQENLKSDNLVKDYTALLLTGAAKYIVEAKDADGNLIGAASNVVEGTRSLTGRETLLRIIESMRFALVDEGLFGTSKTNTVTLENGGTFKYTKDGFYTSTYTYELENFSPYGLTLNTSANPISYQAKSLVSSIKTSTPFVGTVAFEGGSLTFNDVVIDNNDRDAPVWLTGTLDFIFNENTTSYKVEDGIESEKNTIPFAFYMSKDTFVQNLLDENGQYLQQ